MPRLIAAFIRHGDYRQLADVPSALQPFALTEKGHLQAVQAGKTLLSYCQQHQWVLHSTIYCSSSLRAWQTATQIQSVFNQESSHSFFVESHDALCERSVGCVANLTTAQIETIMQEDPRYESPPAHWKSNSDYSLPFQGAESLIQAGQRVSAYIQQRLLKFKTQINDDTLMIFVGHGASFRHAAYHLGLLTFDQIAKLSMYHAHPLLFELMDDQHFQHIAGDWKLRNNQEAFTD